MRLPLLAKIFSFTTAVKTTKPKTKLLSQEAAPQQLKLLQSEAVLPLTLVEAPSVELVELYYTPFSCLSNLHYSALIL